MKHLNQYINIRKGKSTIKASDMTIRQIVKDELDRLGHDADLNHIDVSKVTNMYALFSCDGDYLGLKYEDLNHDISRWDVSNVQYMRYMFYGCKNFDQDLSQWDVSNVEVMSGMFWGCENFNQNLSEWEVINVKNMYAMFYKCENFNQDLSKWDVIKVEEYEHIFDNCPIKEEYKPKFK